MGAGSGAAANCNWRSGSGGCRLCNSEQEDSCVGGRDRRKKWEDSSSTHDSWKKYIHGCCVRVLVSTSVWQYETE